MVLSRIRNAVSIVARLLGDRENGLEQCVQECNRLNSRIELARSLRLVLRIFMFIVCAIGVRYFITNGWTLRDMLDSGIVFSICILVCMGILVAEKAVDSYIEGLQRRMLLSVVPVFSRISEEVFGGNGSPLAIFREMEDIVNGVAAVLLLLSPIIAVLKPNFLSFFRFSSAMLLLSKNWDSVYARLYGFYASWRERFNCKQRIAMVASFLVLCAGVLAVKRKRRSKRVPTKVVQKRRQEIAENTECYPPVIASTSNQCVDCDSDDDSVADESYRTSKTVEGVWSGIGNTATIPSSPQFKGGELVHSSLVRVKASYMATGFRCGNSIITAIHCLGFKNEKSREKGVWLQNPEDDLFYWAPLEREFINAHAEDGVAVCSLPNAQYFLNLRSVSLCKPKSTEPVMSFTLNVGSRKPTWSMSTGSSYLDENLGLTVITSTILRGSSGGPLMNTDGSVFAIVWAETTYKGEPINLGIGVSQEVIDFLVNGGAVVPSTSDIQSQGQSPIEFIRIKQQRTSLKVKEWTDLDSNGHRHVETIKSRRLKNFIGEQMKRKKRPDVRPPINPSPPLPEEEQYPES